VRKIIEAFPLSEEERGQLLHFRDTLTRLLHEAWGQARAKLMSTYRAIVEGTYRIEGSRLCAPDGAWMRIDMFPFPPFIPIHGVSAETYFPDVLKLPRERLELLQLGWRASDEGEVHNKPFMNTTRPWQVFAWVAMRHGELYIYINAAKLTREGVSVHVYIKAKSWEQKWSKVEAVNLLVNYFRHGEWAPLLTMWLGDGSAERKRALCGEYKLVITTKEPWRLKPNASTRKVLVATGKEAFEKLRKAAGIYGTLLDVLRAHKWVIVKLATDDAFKAAHKLRTKWCVVIAGVEMSLYLAGKRTAVLLAERYTRDPEKALAIAGRLESAGLRPNIVRSGPNYVVYVATTDLLKLAERDVEIRRTIALYLAEKARNGTPKQRELAKKILEKHSSLFSLSRTKCQSGSPCRSRKTSRRRRQAWSPCRPP
jgi:hypothetical protein